LGRGTLELLIVHEMFLTETAKVATSFFPAASAYATFAVSVKNISCTISSSSVPRPKTRRAECASGFAPTTYSAFNFPACAASTICGAVSPGFVGIGRSPTVLKRLVSVRIAYVGISRQAVGQHSHIRSARELA